jgi:hypothetical protein
VLLDEVDDEFGSGKVIESDWDNPYESPFIQISDSPYGHATFTVPKKDGTFRIVQDY